MELPMPDVRGRIDDPQIVESPNAAVFGRIVGNSVLELAFRCPRDAEVFVGDLLIAEGEREGEREREPPLLFRITDIRFGLEGEPELGARMAGRMLVLE